MTQLVCGAKLQIEERGRGRGGGRPLNKPRIGQTLNSTETDFFKKTELLIIIPDDLDI